MPIGGKNRALAQIIIAAVVTQIGEQPQILDPQQLICQGLQPLGMIELTDPPAAWTQHRLGAAHGDGVAIGLGARRVLRVPGVLDHGYAPHAEVIGQRPGQGEAEIAQRLRLVRAR